MSVLAYGNRKLPKTIAIFNLPHLLTCPNATILCKEICYAKKAERSWFHNTMKSRMINFNLSLRHDFSDILVKEIKKSKRNIIRIHESGDFYSQNYLDKWIKVMNYFPSKTFYTYTRSKLNYNKKPSNFILYFSVDKTTDAQAYVWYINNLYKNGIAELNDEKADCPANCKICDKCFNVEKSGNVFFRKH